MSARKRGLGRGLDALLGDTEALAAPAEQTRAGAREVAVTRVRPNKEQPRTEFDDAELESLAASIAAQGIIQPIVVTEEPSGDFMILAGERRWRAAQRAGLTHVPVLVREVDSDQHRLELALVENLQRADLNPLEEAEAYQVLRERFGSSQAHIAEQVGKARSTVTNALRLLRLPEEVRELLREGALSPGQARPLLSLSSVDRQVALATEAVKQGLSARDVEAAVTSAPSKPAKPRPKAADANALAAEQRLTQALQSKVEIRRRGAGGELRIHFHSEEELMRLYELIVGR